MSVSPQPFQDPFDLEPRAWEPKELAKSSHITSIRTHKKELVDPYDTPDDFHDPFSELSLFLAQKVRSAAIEPQKWSTRLQEQLLKTISLEFQKRFPACRLSIAAVKKSWERMHSYLRQLQGQPEALTLEGKLNQAFFIRENLKEYATPLHAHPYHLAHKLALKLGECLATLEGVRPKIDELTKLIWSVQKHLISAAPQAIKSPYDAHDKIDKLIIKIMLEILAKDPQISEAELKLQIKESLHSLHELPAFASVDAMTASVSSLLAEKLYATSSFHTAFLAPQKEAILCFVRRQIALCQKTRPVLEHTELVRRVLALYALACRLPKKLTQTEISAAIAASYPVEKRARPELPQAVYAFIAAESVLMKTEEYCHCSEFVAQAIAQAYQEATELPSFEGSELLEIVIWKILAETEGTLEKLPYKIGLRIEEEIAGILIDNPEQNLSSIAELTVQFFKKTKELSLIKKWEELEKKVHRWAQQRDMVLRFIRLDTDSTLYQLVHAKWEKGAPQNVVSSVAQEYLQMFPQLAVYLPQLVRRIWTLYKYAFYSREGMSSYALFLRWQMLFLPEHLSAAEKSAHLQEIASRTLPLFPFEQKICA